MDLVELGKVLEEGRMALGMSRAELARRVGISKNYVWRIERAREGSAGEPSQPSEEVLLRWAEALRWDRPYAQRLLVLAGHAEPIQWPQSVSQGPALLFNSGALHFPQLRRLERDVLAQELQELLSLAEENEQEEEIAELIRSHFAWLRFRLESTNARR